MEYFLFMSAGILPIRMKTFKILGRRDNLWRSLLPWAPNSNSGSKMVASNCVPDCIAKRFEVVLIRKPKDFVVL